MSFCLVVVSDFGDYRKGDTITDPDTIKAVQASDTAHHTIRAFAPQVAPTAPVQE